MEARLAQGAGQSPAVHRHISLTNFTEETIMTVRMGPKPKTSPHAHPLVKFLVDELHDRGISQRDFSEQVGYCKTAIWRWGTGEVTPGVIALENHLNALGYRLEAVPMGTPMADTVSIAFREPLRQVEWGAGYPPSQENERPSCASCEAGEREGQMQTIDGTVPRG
jgi:transcriptional regulator with XRE-family HTH domain